MIPRYFMKTAAPFVRQFGTTAARRAHDTSGIVGSTLPFSLGNRYLLALGFLVYFGSGLSLPFLIVRRGLLKQKTS